jgi:hypothetical protein
MALPYPEGEVFFERSVLRAPGGYSANNIDHFYSHFMVEYIWNVPANHGSKSANSPNGHHHSRSPYKIVKGSNWGTHYGNWTQLPFNYGRGNDNPNNISERRQHNLCTWGDRFKNQEKGDSAEAWFMTIPMPKKDQRWVWIDVSLLLR